jgi:peptide/nickel transport system permease protein
VSIAEYLLRRIGLAVLVILGVMLIVFLVSRVVPGDPARLYLGPRASAERLEEVREELGLNDALPVQFARYVVSTLQGDLGYSFRTKRPIVEDLRVRLPATMELVIIATLLALVIGVAVGVVGASRRGRWFDQSSRIATIAGVSVPAFWLALLLQLLFFSTLDILPLGGRLSQDIQLNHPITQITGFYLIDAAITGNWIAWKDAAWHVILPAIVLAIYPISLAVRMTRASMVEVLSEPYIVAARAAGLSEREILFKLALKNGIVPTLTVMGLIFAYSITGAVLVEIVFVWPGMGSYMTEAIMNSDIYVLFAVTLVVTIIYVVINIVVDAVQASLDARIRIGGGQEG